MTTDVIIYSKQPFDFDAFATYIDIPDLVLDDIVECEDIIFWGFHLEQSSTTRFILQFNRKNSYTICVENLASYSDLKFFPYLVDTLCKFLHGKLEWETPKGKRTWERFNGKMKSDNIYQLFDEDWVEETITQEIAYFKGTISMPSYYFIHLPMQKLTYISLETLYDYGVNLHSSTPRIYGYIQYILENGSLPDLNDLSDIKFPDVDEEEIEVDIPQHESIGRVKSWQLDGSETYESYSKEDVEHLLALASAYRKGKALHGVVLNDIGTIHQEGIGMEVDGEAAIFWFTEASKAGDKIYAPTNLGDLYRKGCGIIKPSLEKAFEAYQLSDDPYAHYRIGQAYEEGWIDTPNPTLAMKWYQQAAEEGHHLAIKRLQQP